MNGLRKRLVALAETWGPLLTGSLVFVLLLTFEEKITEAFVTNEWSLTGLYTAVFGWASIQTGFVFGIYGFVVGKTDGFIGETRRSRSMILFVRYTRRAIILGFILTVVSIPLIVANKNASHILGWWYAALSAWFALFSLSFGAFARVAFIFGLIARVEDKRIIKG